MMAVTMMKSNNPGCKTVVKFMEIWKRIRIFGILLKILIMALMSTPNKRVLADLAKEVHKLKSLLVLLTFIMKCKT